VLAGGSLRAAIIAGAIAVVLLYAVLAVLELVALKIADLAADIRSTSLYAFVADAIVFVDVAAFIADFAVDEV
jgi:hypothetical protein